MIPELWNNALMTLKFLPSLLFSVLLISSSNALDGDIHDFFLPNGLKVILMERHGAPKVAVNIAYNVGSHDEPKRTRGINDIVTKAIVLEGTKLYPDEKLSKMRDELGANYGDRTTYDISLFWTEIHIDGLDFILDVESDRMTNAIINDDVLEKMKERYYVDWQDNNNNNEIGLAFNNALDEFMPKDHPYRSLQPTPDQINSLTVKSCQAWYESYYSPNNAVLVIVGDVEPIETTKMIYNYFGHIPPSDNIPADPSLSIKGIGLTTSISKQSASSEYMSFPGSFIGSFFYMPSTREDDAVILKHITNIIELSIEKRDNLYKRFSKNRRLFIGAEVQYMPMLGYSGFFLHSINVFRMGSVNKINKQILSTFKYIGDNGIENKLFEQYKKLELLEEYEEYYAYRVTARRLIYAELILGDYQYYNRELEILNDLTNDDIKRVVKKYFNKDNRKTVVISMNDNKKHWYTPIISFVANQFVLRLWDPEK